MRKINIAAFDKRISPQGNRQQRYDWLRVGTVLRYYRRQSGILESFWCQF